MNSLRAGLGPPTPKQGHLRNETMNLHTRKKGPKRLWLSLHFPGGQWISRWIGNANMPFLLKGWWCHNLIMEKLLVIMLFGGLGRSPDVAFQFNKKPKAHSPDTHGLRSGIQHCSPTMQGPSVSSAALTGDPACSTAGRGWMVEPWPVLLPCLMTSADFPP